VPFVFPYFSSMTFNFGSIWLGLIIDCGMEFGLINLNWMEEYHQPSKLRRQQEFENWWWKWKRLCRLCVLFLSLFCSFASYVPQHLILWVGISMTLDIDFLFVCFLCVFFQMNMNCGCVVVALVFEDVHYGIF
jgi:hypothetical protein